MIETNDYILLKQLFYYYYRIFKQKRSGFNLSFVFKYVNKIKYYEVSVSACMSHQPYTYNIQFKLLLHLCLVTISVLFVIIN